MWLEAGDAIFVRYLLGELGDAERDEFEDQYFAEDAVHERLLAIECELIDAYVRSELTPTEVKGFEARYLTTAEGRERVARSRALRTYSARSLDVVAPAFESLRSEDAQGELTPSATAALLATNGPEVVRWITNHTSKWDNVMSLFRLRTAAWRLVLVPTAALSVGLCLFLIWRPSRQAPAVTQTTRRPEAPHPAVPQSLKDLPSTAETSLASQSRLRSSAEPPLLIATITPSVRGDVSVRGANQNILRIAPSLQTVKLQVVLHQGDFSSYRARLRTAEGSDLLVRDHLRPIVGDDGSKLLELTLASNLFATGNYTIQISGTDDVGQKEDAGVYQFQCVLDGEQKPSVRYASLHIKGATPEAEVLLAGISLGTVGSDGGLKKDNVLPGDHTVVLRRTDYEERSFPRTFAAGQTVRISGADGQLTPYGALDFHFSPPVASVSYKRNDEAQPHVAESGKLVRVIQGSYLVTARAAGYQNREEPVNVEPGKTAAVNLTLLPVEGGRRVSSPPPPPLELFQDPSAWQKDGPWRVHKGDNVSWLSVKQGTYLIEFLRQTARTLGIKRTKHVEWIIDQKNAANHVDYTFDFSNLTRRATLSGKPQQPFKSVMTGAAGESYTLEMDIGLQHVVIRDAEGKELDRYQRPSPSQPLGQFGFKGDVVLAIRRAGNFTLGDMDTSGAARVNRELNAFCASQRTTFTKYPFQPLSRNDGSLEEFANVFDPDKGAFWKFEQQSLRDYVLQEGKQWKPKDPAKKPGVAPEMLVYLNRAQQIRDVFYGTGSKLGFSYTLRPKQDPRWKDAKLELKVDGQSYLWANPFQRTLNWPARPGAPDVGAVATMRIPGTPGIPFTSEGGIWGIFRTMADAEARDEGNGLVVWKYSGRGQRELMDVPVQVEIVDFPGGVDIFNPKFWVSLGCPAVAVQ